MSSLTNDLTSDDYCVSIFVAVAVVVVIHFVFIFFLVIYRYSVHFSAAFLFFWRFFVFVLLFHIYKELTTTILWLFLFLFLFLSLLRLFCVYYVRKITKENPDTMPIVVLVEWTGLSCCLVSLKCWMISGFINIHEDEFVGHSFFELRISLICFCRARTALITNGFKLQWIDAYYSLFIESFLLFHIIVIFVFIFVMLPNEIADFRDQFRSVVFHFSSSI